MDIRPTDPGTKSATWIELPKSAEQSALGDVCVSKDSPEANAAALGEQEGFQASAMYDYQFNGVVNNGYLGLAYKNIGGSLTYVGVPKIERYNSSMEKEGEFNVNNVALTLSGALNLTEKSEKIRGPLLGHKVDVGCSVKVIREDYGGEAAYGVAGDVGLLWKYKHPYISASPLNFSGGLVVSNAGYMWPVREATSPMPVSVKAGLAWTPIQDENNKVTVGVGAAISNYKLGATVGIEYTIYKSLTLRASYDTSKPSYYGFAAGVGFETGGVSIDYAYSLHPDLGHSHLISLTYRYQPLF